jgi:peptidylprolyl isomerase
VRRVLACLTAVLALTACTGDAKPKAAPSPTVSTPAPVIPTTKPKIVVPTGPAPTTLVKTDLIVGTGDYAVTGRSLAVNYVGAFYKNGQEFDSSWESGHPLNFVAGNEDVIPGWDEGVIGMRVGGRRELIIPPDLAYGASGRGDIGPNETLVFVVDLVSVSGGFAPPPGATP